MLKKIRVILAAVFWTVITLMFLDFTGTLHTWFSWMAEIQFLPAVLAMNVGVVVLLLLLTFLFGRVYCSVICPMGVFQDIISWISGKRKKHRNRFSYSPAKTWLRYTILVVFVLLMIIGVNSIAVLVAPYSAYGRIVSQLFAPIYIWGNNLLAYFAEKVNSYAFYSTEVWLKSLPTFIIAIATFVAVFVLAWRHGRTYCNTICPVGSILGLLSKISLFKIQIDTDKCNHCGLCARNCKASCIDSKNQTIDYSRCVDCFDCIEKCKQHAIGFQKSYPKKSKNIEKLDTAPQASTVDVSRRNMLTLTGALLVTSAVQAQKKKIDGGLAAIEKKQIPHRQTRIIPAGAWSIHHFEQYCTACQLCVSACPNQVLRPSNDIDHLMQPELSYERGYCRPECTKCSEVCPAKAIKPISKAEKSSTQIGHAVWIKANCISYNEGIHCNNCAEHCPSGAITMIAPEGDSNRAKIPAIHTERCIGCGACENLCPARPFSAIYVEGNEVHHSI